MSSIRGFLLIIGAALLFALGATLLGQEGGGWGSSYGRLQIEEERGVIVDPLYADERLLRETISLKAKRVTVSTLLKHLSEMGNIKLIASPQIRARHVTFYVYQRPLHQAMRGLSLALDANWVKHDDGYMLVPIVDQKERERLMVLSGGRLRRTDLEGEGLLEAFRRLYSVLEPEQIRELGSEKGLPVSEIPFKERKFLYDALKGASSVLVQPRAAFLRSLYENGVLEMTIEVEPFSGLPKGVMRLYPAGGQGPVFTIPFVLGPIETTPKGVGPPGAR